MTDLKQIRVLNVLLHKQPIGVITRLGGDRYLFSFEDSYIDNPNRPTLSLSFKDVNRNLITSLKAEPGRLPAFFSNILPEGTLRKYLAERAGVKENQEFFLLAALGADLPGALTVCPAEPSGYAEELPDTPKNATRQESNILRFSLAGVQLKFSAIQNATGGLTIPASGIGGEWIVKLPSYNFPAVAENEFVMLALARAIGINTPLSRLIDTSKIEGLPVEAAALKGKGLAVARFDRSQNGAVHMEDFAQVFGLWPHDKYKKASYANIAAILSSADENGAYDFFRRIVFSVLIGNGDMHLKNWSVLYPDQIHPILSPAYDILSTVVYFPAEQLSLSFGGSKEMGCITQRQVEKFAEVASLPSSKLWKQTVDTVDQTVAAWEGLAEKVLLPDELKNMIEKQIKGVARRSLPPLY